MSHEETTRSSTITAIMPDETHYRKLENLYHGAPINRFYAPKLTIREGEAELLIEIKPDFYHAADAVHGSIYFKMLDDAAFFAVNSLIDDTLALTASFNVYLLRPASEGMLRAVGRAVESTSRLHIGEAELFDAEGRLIGSGSGSFMRSGLELGAHIGYV